VKITFGTNYTVFVTQTGLVNLLVAFHQFLGNWLLRENLGSAKHLKNGQALTPVILKNGQASYYF